MWGERTERDGDEMREGQGKMKVGGEGGREKTKGRVEE